MPLSNEERIEIILMAGSGSCRKVAIDFNRKHGKHVKHDTHDKIQNMDHLKERNRVHIKLRYSMQGCKVNHIMIQ